MTIYLIAGPPGIGKSTHSPSFIPTGVPIVDQDLDVTYASVTELTEAHQPLPAWVQNNNLHQYLLTS